MRTDSKKATPCNFTSLKNDTSENKCASHKRLQSEIIQDGSFLEKTFKKHELNILCKVYEVQNLKLSFTKKVIAQLLKPAILQAEGMKNDRLSTIDEDMTSAEGSFQTDDKPSSSGLNREQECEQPPVSPCSSQPVLKKIDKKTETVNKRKRSSKGKRKKIKKGPVKWPCGICHLDASSDSVGCDRCDTWYHGDCLKIENLDDLGDEWFCKNCMEEMEIESTCS